MSACVGKKILLLSLLDWTVALDDQRERSKLSLIANTPSNMTSPPLGFSASAEQYSGSGAPSHDRDSPVSSFPLSPRNSLSNGSAYVLGGVIPVVPTLPTPPRVHYELPEFLRADYAAGSCSPLIKRTLPQIEHGSLKSCRDTGILQQLPSITNSSIEAHASHHHAPKRASSRARAYASGGSRTVSYDHGFHVGRRTPGRPYRGLFRSSDTRVNNEGEVAISVTSANPRTAAFKDVQARPLFDSAKLNSSLDCCDNTGASVPNSLSVVMPSPSFSAREPYDPYLSSGPLSPHLRNSISSSLSSTWSPIEPSPSLTSFGSPYGSPGVPIPIPRPPYQILPTPNALVSQQDTPQPSVEVDGYTIIRNAVSPALVREVVASIYKGLSVTARYETERIYTTPIPAYKVRDEFVSVCHSSSFQLWN